MIDQKYLWIAISVFILSGCATNQVIGYKSDIKPILKNKCHKCHLPPDGEGYLETGLSMESYDTLMTGNLYGKVIIPGDSKRSVLNMLVEGRAGKMMRMPHGDAKKLTTEEVEFLMLWVNQGALNN